MMSGVVPPNQTYWLCPELECGAVYFGEDATVLTKTDMNVSPGIKSKSREALVCYCFQHRRGDIEAELLADGQPSILDRITAEVKAGNCACEVRNPSGKCCLGDVQKAMQEIRTELACISSRVAKRAGEYIPRSRGCEGRSEARQVGPHYG